jgi:Carboxypeptidase regulatory-like domain
MLISGLAKRFLVGLTLLAGLVLIPATARAQSSIAGLVKDTSGAVMPGVTVEASSPALIEKVRSVVTDGQGQYKIVDLRPGVYAITFTLPGFNTVKRDGIELPTNFTATVNADLRVGALEETVTVSGASPVVDVQNAVQ